MNKFFNAAIAKDTLTMSMYDMIGESWDGEGATPAMVADALKGSFKNIEVHLNSPGGDAFAGVAIYNLLKACSKPVNVFVDGLAASAASIVAMAGDTIKMNSGSVMMIHNAMSMAFGDSTDMRKTADTLDTVTSGIADIYVAKTGLDKQTVLDMQSAETWMTADEAVAKGFATCVGSDPAVKNEFNLKMFRNAPKTEVNSEAEPAAEPVAAEPVAVESEVINDTPDVSVFSHQLEINKRK